MSSYTIQSKALNKNRVFILQKSELEKRLDPFYYIPEISELEKKVLAKNPKKLRDFIKKIASGATPKTTESEKYYAEKENGIPFLRVQNLSPTGILEFDDCKFINEETHNGMLKRSQVSEGDLLVKITGVGRMAVASVAPENFEGNINQHVCVIKTGSKELSETIAAFLNSDIGEKLASRRSTGGTRPALDYPALLSIPIIDDSRILEISKKVAEQKKQHEAEAEKLLASIDDYLLAELGIILPEPPENNLKSRIFTTTLKEISGNRIDPVFYKKYFIQLVNIIHKGKYKPRKIKNILSIQTGLQNVSEFEFINYIDLSCINKVFGNVDRVDNYSSDFPSRARQKVKKGDLLLSVLAGSLKSIAIINENFENLIASTGFFVINEDKDNYNSLFLLSLFRSKLYQKIFERFTSGAIMASLNYNDFRNLYIPVPPIEKQNEIAEHIKNIRQEAQTLKDEVKTDLENARREIEKIIFEN